MQSLQLILLTLIRFVFVLKVQLDFSAVSGSSPRYTALSRLISLSGDFNLSVNNVCDLLLTTSLELTSKNALARIVCALMGI